jgi:hypothetical protein
MAIRQAGIMTVVTLYQAAGSNGTNCWSVNRSRSYGGYRAFPLMESEHVS